VLTTRATEAAKRILRDVIAALHGNLLDGIGHVINRNLEKSFSHCEYRTVVAGLFANGLSQLGELFLHDSCIDWLIALGSENFREMRWLQFTQD